MEELKSKKTSQGEGEITRREFVKWGLSAIFPVLLSACGVNNSEKPNSIDYCDFPQPRFELKSNEIILETQSFPEELLLGEYKERFLRTVNRLCFDENGKFVPDYMGKEVNKVETKKQTIFVIDVGFGGIGGSDNHQIYNGIKNAQYFNSNDNNSVFLDLDSVDPLFKFRSERDLPESNKNHGSGIFTIIREFNNLVYTNPENIDYKLMDCSSLVDDEDLGTVLRLNNTAIKTSLKKILVYADKNPEESITANLSFGSTVFDTEMELLLEALSEKGVLLVTSSGNYQDQEGKKYICNLYPGNFDGVFSALAGDPQINRESENPEVSLKVSYTVTDYSTLPTTGNAFIVPGKVLIPIASKITNRSYVEVDGTSFASPILASVINMWKQATGSNDLNALELMKTSGENVPVYLDGEKKTNIITPSVVIPQELQNKRIISSQ